MEVAHGVRSGEVSADWQDVNTDIMTKLEYIEAEVASLKKTEAELRSDILRINLKISKVRRSAYNLQKIINQIKKGSKDGRDKEINQDTEKS